MKYSYKGKAINPVVEVVHGIVPPIAGISDKEFFTDYTKCAAAWKTAKAFLTDYYKGMVNVPGPYAPLSYGHLISIGAPVIIPEDGEPNVKPFANSIDEAIEILKVRKDKGFADNPMFEYYMEMCRYFKDYFNESRINFRGYGVQGPLTSAVLMRGLDFLYDIYDEPEKSKEFLYLLTDSIVDFIKFSRRINDAPEIIKGGGICDDFASLIPPDMWNDFVIPYFNQEFEGVSSGGYRSMHIENLTPNHLKHLSKAKLNHFQPSVSDALTIENIKANLDPSIAFDWLLYSYVVTMKTESEIQEWIDTTVQAGITSVRTQMDGGTYKQKKLHKILEFFKGFEKYGEV